MLSDEEIEAMKVRYQNATPGPWTSWIEGRDFSGGDTVITTEGEDIYLRGASHADHDFIAHSRQDIPRLIEEVLRLRREST